MIDSQVQQLKDKDAKIAHVNDRITDMQGVMQKQADLDVRRKNEITRLESKIVENQHDITHLETENHKLKAKLSASKEKAHLHRSTSEQYPEPVHPIMSKERHTLTAGMAKKLLNDLRRDLARTEQEKTDLAQMLVKQQEELGEEAIPQTALHPKTEIYHQIMKHTKPFGSIIQYHRVYGGLNLVLNNIPLLRVGCNLELGQLQEIWNHANAVAKDTLVFMWCLGDIKTPLGVMEVILGSPPFYVKRYILRCVKLLGQHHRMTKGSKEPLPSLRSYSHGQYHLIKNLQRSKMDYFNHALATLSAEDTTVCFEAVQQYQAFTTKHPDPNLQPTLSQLKDFVNGTLEDQQATLASRKFGVIKSGILLFQSQAQAITQEAGHQSMGTCFL